MSTTLMPSSGPMVWFAPDADGAFARAAFPDLVTAGRPEDQGHPAYGRMRERQHRRGPGERGCEYIPDLILRSAPLRTSRRMAASPRFASILRDRLTVIARSAATKQSISPHKERMDCFASLAMTLIEFRIRLHPRRAMRPRRYLNLPRQRGRGECRAHEAIHRPGRHMWTAPIGKLFFDVTNDLVSFSHMSGLLVRHDGRWP